jgi:Salmonella virulence plasmid 65kDa B protein
VIIQNLISQNTNYSSLFTNSSFIKTIDLSRPVGTLAGAPSTSAGGAAYSIPIALPPGTNNVVPSISLGYSSMGGSGVAGRGWSVGGLYVISRTGQTVYHDGYSKPPNIGTDDRFSLDGKSGIFHYSGFYNT